MATQTSETTVTLVVKFWEEDGVWNAAAEDLPVAVYADSLTNALAKVREAVLEHVNLSHELGFSKELIQHLHDAAASKHAVEDVEPGELLGRVVARLPHLADCHA